MDARGLSYRRPSTEGWTLPCAVEQFWTGPDSEPDHHRWRTTIGFLVGDPA
jgi:hypothetical protein